MLTISTLKSPSRTKRLLFSLAVAALSTSLFHHTQIATLNRSLAMAPSAAKIESALRAAIQETIDEGNEEALTVRYVRNKVTESLKLDEGFFLTEDWKARSKAFINDCAVSWNCSQSMRRALPIQLSNRVNYSMRSNKEQPRPLR